MHDGARMAQGDVVVFGVVMAAGGDAGEQVLRLVAGDLGPVGVVWPSCDRPGDEL